MLQIQTAESNEAVLRKRCEEVTAFDAELAALVEQMHETMVTPDPETGVYGVGIAANQVGISKRVILVTFNYDTSKKKKIVTMVNPEIVEQSAQEVWMDEGCLSVPDETAEIKRAAKVKIRWQTIEGNWSEKKLSDWDARIFLHEYDHLEGKLFTDYL